MSSRILTLSCFLMTLAWSGGPTAFAQEAYFYKDGKKVALKVVPEKKYVLFKPSLAQNAAAQSIERTNGRAVRINSTEPLTGLNMAENYQAAKRNWAIVVSDTPSAAADVPKLDLSPARTSIAYEAPVVQAPDGTEVGVSHLVYVKLKDEDDVDKLREAAAELKVTIVGNNKFLPRWYTLEASSESAGNALEVANKLYETGDFEVAEPDFLNNYAPETSDTHFGDQWGLKNTGQHDPASSGIDVGAEGLWALTKGDPAVIVAVLDHGIEVGHPDLPNLSSSSYDTPTGNASQIRGSHGTPCAGIIGAATDNGTGVAGLAPDVTLMSISDPLLVSPGAPQQLANGISWAWQNGAAVISNSWGHNQLVNTILEDAIETALTDGRGGKGTVVVFAAGNSNLGTVGYPARVHPDIIAVGAMSPCGERKSPVSCDPENFWGSNYGTALDIIAPGVLIPTTDRTGSAGYDSGDYTLTFNGTSSACPHVAAIAGSMLSVNPNLTGKQVGDIIESTARKVGSYGYATVPGRPNGTWHQEVGHGLLDAKAAVQKAKDLLSGDEEEGEEEESSDTKTAP